MQHNRALDRGTKHDVMAWASVLERLTRVGPVLAAVGRLRLIQRHRQAGVLDGRSLPDRDGRFRIKAVRERLEARVHPCSASFSL
jgi:hypothetical protein